MVILTALPALLLLREASRWLVVPILRHLVVFVAAVAALFTGAAAWAWGLFLVLIVLPRLANRQAVRCAKAGRLPAAQRWRRVARCGAAEPPDTAEVPGALRGEIRLWRLWSLTGTQQWPAAIAFYEGVESWGTLGAAMQARLAVARVAGYLDWSARLG